MVDERYSVTFQKISTVSNGLATQYGTIAVNNEGTRVRVLTCKYLQYIYFYFWFCDKSHKNNIVEHFNKKRLYFLCDKQFAS